MPSCLPCCALALLSSSCSLLFDAASTEADDGDAAVPVADAPPAFVCADTSFPAVHIISSSIGEDQDFPDISSWESSRQGNLVDRVVYQVTDKSGGFLAGETLSSDGNCSGTLIASSSTSAVGDLVSFDDFDQCCDAGSTMVGLMGSLILGNPVARGVVEKGVLTTGRYEEAVNVSGSMTSPESYMWLSASDESRHLGLMDQGAVVNPPPDERDGITIFDDHTRLSWLALTDWSTKQNSRGVRVVADGVRLDHLFLYNEGSTVMDPDGVGISLEEDGATLWVSHSIVSGVSRSGFSARGVDQTAITNDATIEVYASAVAHTGYEDSNNSGAGFDGTVGSGTRLRVYSTIGFHKTGSNRAMFKGLKPAFGDSSHNISDDPSAGTLEIGTPSNNLATLLENDSPEFIDFHWKSYVTCLPGANLLQAGLLTAEEAIDINGDARPATGAWCAGPHQKAP